MSYRPNALSTQTIAQTPAASSVLGTYTSFIDDGSSTGAHVSEAQRLAYMLANDGSTDLAAATALTSIPSDFAVPGISGGAPVKIAWTTLLAAAVAASSGGTAPSQVGSLAAGTPTSTTVPLTWTAATGTATIAYTVQQSLHGANTWTNSAGTFTATGGTVTGLTASTSYDFRVIATNGVGSSTTNLTSGVSSAGGGFTPGPSMTFATAPTYVTGKFSGFQAETNGIGTVTIPALPANPAPSDGVTTYSAQIVSFWYKSGGNTLTASYDFLRLAAYGAVSGSTAPTNTPGIYFSGSNFGLEMKNGTAQAGTANVHDGLWHFIEWLTFGDYGRAYSALNVDCAADIAAVPGSASAPLGQLTNVPLILDGSQLGAGDAIFDLVVRAGKTFSTTNPTSPAARTSNSAPIVLLPFNGNGTGS